MHTHACLHMYMMARLIIIYYIFCPDRELHTNIEIRRECLPQQRRQSGWHASECSLLVGGTDKAAKPRTGAECYGMYVVSNDDGLRVAARVPEAQKLKGVGEGGDTRKTLGLVT